MDSSPAGITEGRARHGGGSSQGCRQPGKSHLPSEIREWRALCPPKFGNNALPLEIGEQLRPRRPEQREEPPNRDWAGVCGWLMEKQSSVFWGS